MNPYIRIIEMKAFLQKVDYICYFIVPLDAI